MQVTDLGNRHDETFGRQFDASGHRSSLIYVCTHPSQNRGAPVDRGPRPPFR